MAGILRAKYSPETVLSNWSELIRKVGRMNEEELRASLDKEVHGEKRQDFVLRLHRRYSKLRARRELSEYLSEAKAS